jgi:DNA-binding NtrC family response regulator
MKASVLLVSENESLSRSRVLLLRDWGPLAVTAMSASEAIATGAYDLLILCQTVDDEIAAKLAQEMLALHPAAKVLVINRRGQPRRFGTVQHTVDMTNPGWLADAVDRTLSATAL